MSGAPNAPSSVKVLAELPTGWWLLRHPDGKTEWVDMQPVRRRRPPIYFFQKRKEI